MSDVILDLALRTAGTPAFGIDLDRHLTETCTALVRALRVTAVAIVVLEPAGAYGSDAAAVLLGKTQLGASVGPVANALRTGRTMLTPDLMRVGPPALAAAAAECGLVGSGVLPLRAIGRPVGAVQLLGTRGWPIKGSHLGHLEPLLPVLAAKLADVAALARPPAPASRRPAPTPRSPLPLAPFVPSPAPSPRP